MVKIKIEDKPEYKCNQCYYTYEHNADLITHISLKHNNDIPKTTEEIFMEMKLILEETIITTFDYETGTKKKIKEVKTKQVYVNNITLQRLMTLLETGKTPFG